MKKYFYSGSYTLKSGNAINLCSVDDETGELKIEKGFSGIDNPSYLAVNQANDRLYALSETDGSGMLTAYCIDGDGKLERINSADVTGGQLCHIALNRNERIIAVAGYETGTVDLFKINDDGSIGDNFFSVKHEGRGIVDGRQDCPHCHFVFFPENRNSTFYVTDLGNDTLYRYSIHDTTVKEVSRLKLPSGDGPRHIIQSNADKDLIYLVCEISFKVHTIRMFDNCDRIIDTVSTLPDGADYYGGAGAIRINGGFMYVSNRVLKPEGEGKNSFDSIVRFELGSRHLPENPVFFDIGNDAHKMPRDINLFGDIFVSAAQNSNCVSSYRINHSDGTIKNKLSSIIINKPVCILPIKKEKNNERT